MATAEKAATEQEEQAPERLMTPTERDAKAAEARIAAQKAEEQRRRDEEAMVDRFGMLDHLVQRFSQPEHPATFAISGKAGKVKVTLTFDREVNGKWQQIKKSGTGINVGEAVDMLRPQLNEATA